MLLSLLIQHFLCYLPGGPLPTPQHARLSGWSVEYKANLFNHVFGNGQDAMVILPEPGKTGGVGFYIPVVDSFFSKDVNFRVAKGDELLDIVVAYILLDSTQYYTRVAFFFQGMKDTALKFVVPYDFTNHPPGKLRKTSTEERFSLLCSLLPADHGKTSELSGPYEQRVLAVLLPSLDRHGNFDLTNLGNYSVNLAELIYDFVLQRHNDAVARIVIQFKPKEKFLDDSYPPDCGDTYWIRSDFFKNIKEFNACIKLKDLQL